MFGALLLAILAFPPYAIGQEKEAHKAAVLVSSVPQRDSRVIRLESYLRIKNPELAGKAAFFVEQADNFGLDWKLVAAISGVESTFCRFIPQGSYNCWGWGIPTGTSSGIGFSSFEDGIAAVSEGIRTKYLNKGLLNVEDIGSVYAASPHWSGKVRYFINDIENHIPRDSDKIPVPDL